MLASDYRILKEYGIQPAQWAVLLSASNYFFAPLKEFMFELELEQAGNFSEYELWNALDVCMQQGWIYEDEEGVLLTPEGQQLKEEVSQAVMGTVYMVMETVEMD